MTRRAWSSVGGVSLAATLLLVSACSTSETTPSVTSGVTQIPAASVTAVASRTAVAPAAPTSVPQTVDGGYKDIAYEIGGVSVRLTGGMSEVAAPPGSASKIVTRIFGNEAVGDLNGDGRADIGFVLTQATGGSGTFYYAVAALRTADGWAGTNAILLGDRIAPQTTEMRNGTLIVNYADRKPGEPMAASPSVGVSKSLRVVGGRLGE